MKDIDIKTVNFDKQGGLIPAVVQDAETRQVLMLGYMNQTALQATLDTQMVTFFSRSRKCLWVKGQTSGNFLQLVGLAMDCDNDTLLVQALPKGPVCHTGSYSCFGFERQDNCDFLPYLQQVIDSRRHAMPADSYTTYLFNAGIDKIAQKVGEEAVETIIEAKNTNDDLLLNESADLIFHLMVLLSARNLSISGVDNILKGRHR